MVTEALRRELVVLADAEVIRQPKPDGHETPLMAVTVSTRRRQEANLVPDGSVGRGQLASIPVGTRSRP